ncbi:SdrD B-like domain-containing protein [Miltoncostaea oceani]|uniref:SdrD B-like domain-containing protein n=1 Tax=Miltoncostaea oceani TaxID=2843216 RepID=UPI001C3CB2CE|nr:SdrD B-like domain-containing protein [Miltoncostaea oceani]
MTSSRIALLRLVALAGLALAGLTLFATPALSANSVSLNRAPAPPQAVLNDGANQVTYNYSITFDSTPDEYTVEVLNPSGVAVQFDTFPASGASSPIVGNGAYTIPAGATPGNWNVRISYYSNVQLEASALVSFNVTDAVGTLAIQKFDDLNGNGQREAGEPGVSNWPIRLIGPTGLSSVQRDFATGADGSLVISSLLVGEYQVQEGTMAGWIAIGPTSLTRSVSSGQTTSAVFANARLGEICGFAYRDVNENGVRDPQELTPVPQTTITLSGAAAGSVVTGADGRYCFGSLPPGVYRVAANGPVGLISSGDADGPANGRALIGPLTLLSGARIIDQDFGFRPPAAVIALTKKASKPSVKAGAVVTFTMRVRNTSTSIARDVVVSDPIPAGVSISKLGGARLIRGELVWRVGNLAPGAGRTVSFRAKTDRSGGVKRVLNIAEAEASNAARVRASAPVRIIQTRIIARPVPVTR